MLTSRPIIETTRSPRHRQHPQYDASIKLGILAIPEDLLVLLMCDSRTLVPDAFEAVHSRGGHFAVYEKPQPLEYYAPDWRRCYISETGEATPFPEEFHATELVGIRPFGIPSRSFLGRPESRYPIPSRRGIRDLGSCRINTRGFPAGVDFYPTVSSHARQMRPVGGCKVAVLTLE